MQPFTPGAAAGFQQGQPAQQHQQYIQQWTGQQPWQWQPFGVAGQSVHTASTQTFPQAQTVFGQSSWQAYEQAKNQAQIQHAFQAQQQRAFQEQQRPLLSGFGQQPLGQSVFGGQHFPVQQQQHQYQYQPYQYQQHQPYQQQHHQYQQYQQHQPYQQQHRPYQQPVAQSQWGPTGFGR